MLQRLLADEMVGKKYGRLTVLLMGARSKGKTTWFCRCECGNHKIVPGERLRNKSGRVRSCGCLRKGINKTHGMTNSPEWAAWHSMRDRCHNPNAQSFHHCGGRGIEVCERWRNSFENFYADVGPKPSVKLTLDRIDNTKGYEPNNVRWATWEQQENNRRNSRWIEIDGERKTVPQWAKDKNIKQVTIKARLRLGWSDRDAVLTPVRYKS